MAYVKKSKKNKVQVDNALVHVKSTFNNTLVTVTTVKGDVLFRGSAGRLNYKGSRKGTPYAASQIAAGLSKDMLSVGVKSVEVNMRGIGAGRDAVLRSLQSSGISISVLRDVTPIAFGGCRPKKRRRV